MHSICRDDVLIVLKKHCETIQWPSLLHAWEVLLLYWDIQRTCSVKKNWPPEGYCELTPVDCLLLESSMQAGLYHIF